MSRTSFVVALLGIVGALSWNTASLQAQNVDAQLVHIDAADVTDEIGKWSRTVCLDGGAYILAFRLLASEDDMGWVSVSRREPHPDPRTPEEREKLRESLAPYMTEEELEAQKTQDLEPQTIVNTYARIIISVEEERRWGWTMFRADDSECYKVNVFGGTARMYSLRVEIGW